MQNSGINIFEMKSYDRSEFESSVKDPSIAPEP